MDSTDKHAPTDEFVEYLARDTMRRLRHEARFGTSVSELRRPPRRIPPAFGIAAGVVMTLATGMVLGASANYASAEVLPNGTTTIPSRPTLAILPIRNALSAIGCTQPAQATTPATTPAIVAAPKAEAPVDQVAVSSPRTNPDRAMIAAYATQFQSSVVRGDTAAQYIVMVLDASHNYVWSTHGTGNLSIEVGADPRTPRERREYDRVHHAEFWGKSSSLAYEYVMNFSARDSGGRVLSGYAWDYKSALDSTMARRRPQLAGIALDSGARGNATRGERQISRGRGSRIQADSLILYDFDFVFSKGYTIGADTVPGVYTNGWSRSRHGSHFNQAAGLHERRPGESGIIGLASSNVSAADIYTFAEGELGPRSVQIMVVHLVPGATWSGR